MGRRCTGRETVLWRKSARASSLCQEPDAAAMPEFAGSVQLASCAEARPRAGCGAGWLFRERVRFRTPEGTGCSNVVRPFLRVQESQNLKLSAGGPDF